MSGLDEDVTSKHPQLASLTPIQAQALDLVLRGCSLKTVASRLQVNRNTVSRWRNHHPAFIAELNRRQDDVLSQSTIRFRRLLHRSINVLNRELGPTDPVAVVNEMAARSQSQWEHPDAILDEQTHLDYANRLAKLDFSAETEPETAKANTEGAEKGTEAA